MSTRYSVEILINGNWEGIALFSDKASLSAMEMFADQQFDCGNSLTCPCDNICIVDMETGEIVFDWNDEHGWDDEYAEVDSEVGFDPYLGCYTDDC